MCVSIMLYYFILCCATFFYVLALLFYVWFVLNDILLYLFAVVLCHLFLFCSQLVCICCYLMLRSFVFCVFASVYVVF